MFVGRTARTRASASSTGTRSLKTVVSCESIARLKVRMRVTSARAVRGHDDALEVRGERAVLGHGRERHLRVQQDRRHDVVELVRDAAGERADGGDALAMLQSPLELEPLLLGDRTLADLVLQPLARADQLLSHVLELAIERLHLAARAEDPEERHEQQPSYTHIIPERGRPRPIGVTFLCRAGPESTRKRPERVQAPRLERGSPPDRERPYAGSRMMQRNPRWQVEVSIDCGMRAAGR